MHTQVCLSRGTKYWFLGKFCVRTKWSPGELYFMRYFYQIQENSPSWQISLELQIKTLEMCTEYYADMFKFCDKNTGTTFVTMHILLTLKTSAYWSRVCIYSPKQIFALGEFISHLSKTEYAGEINNRWQKHYNCFWLRPQMVLK